MMAIFVSFVLPASSWLDGSGHFAWTMFSRSAMYKVRVTAVDVDGRRRLVAPTGLAQYAGPSLGTYLAGAEHLRHGPVGPALRERLDQLGLFACRVERPAASIEIQLDEQASLDAPVRVTRAAVNCDPLRR
jgi:hypothetical protein